MGEKIILGILMLCMATGIWMGPYLWNSTARFTKAEDQRSKKLVIKKAEAEEVMDTSEIRVLLSNQTLGKYLHKKVVLTSEKPYYVRRNGKVVEKKAGQKTTINFRKTKVGQTVIFSGTGKLQILSFRRGYGYPSYRGKLEVHYGEKGIFLVNQLLLEEYLYAVLPSEMPVSYGKEALKVQAVCARTFAVKQMNGKKWAAYDADVDDSVASQVYNNSQECEESIQAVMDTAGEVMKYKGKVISTYFFSTSWGHTADSHDVWIQKGSSPVYLTGSLQKEKKQRWDLSAEKKLKNFLKEDVITYDSDFPWYRWQVTIPYFKLNRQSLGTIQNVQVTERGSSGVAKTLRVTGSKGVREIRGEYRIRTWLSPDGCRILRKDGSIVKNAQILPSGCFVIQEQKDGLAISGGGYGHGVGMSQNGAKKQAETGKTYEEILTYYYPEATLSQK